MTNNADPVRARDMLAEAIRNAAVKRGIVRADADLTGPHLLMLCEDLASASPSAPVGVEGFRTAVEKARRVWMDENPCEDGHDHVTPFDQFLYGSLAQQPAAPSGEAVGDVSGCCDTPAFCSSVRRCTAKDAAPQQPAGVGRVCSEDILWCEDIAESLQEAGGPTNSMRLVALRRLLALAAQQQGGA